MSQTKAQLIDGSVVSVAFSAGTAAAPSIYYSADTTTGVYFPGTGQVALATNGTGRLFVDASGQLGLGTSSPSGILHASASSPNIFIQDTQTHTTSGGPLIQFQGRGPNAINYNFGYIQGLSSGSNNAGVLRFATNSAGVQSVAMTIDSSQRVGIGSNSPSYLLDAQGDAAVGIGAANSNNYAFRIRAGTSGLARIIAADTSDAGYIDYDHSGNSWIFRTSGSEACRIDSSQRLLVGTSTSDAQRTASMQIASAGGLSGWGSSASLSEFGTSYNPWIVLQRSRNGTVGSHTVVSNGDILGGIQFTGSDGDSFEPAAWIKAEVDGTPGANDMPGRLVFSTTADGASSPTERMRITQAGDALFGTTTTASPGTVNRGFLVRNDISGKTYLQIANTGTGTDTAVYFYNGNGLVGSISTSGSATAYNTSSDYRLKENVVSLTGAIDRVNQLQVHRFNFIADPNKTVDGFIAHEAQAVVPECVTGEKDAVDADGNPIYQGIDQSKLVPLLTAALQEAIGRIETLEAEVAALKGA